MARLDGPRLASGRGGIDADDRGGRVAERARIYLGAVAGAHAGLFEAFERSAMAGGERLTRLPSLTSEILPSVMSSPMISWSIASRSGYSVAERGPVPFFMSCFFDRSGARSAAPRGDGGLIRVAPHMIIVRCVLLLVLALIAPRLSTRPQHGVDQALGSGGRVAGHAPGWRQAPQAVQQFPARCRQECVAGPPRPPEDAVVMQRFESRLLAPLTRARTAEIQ